MLQSLGHLATERPFPKVSVVLTHLFFKKFNEVLNEVSMKFENKVAVTRASARITVNLQTILQKIVLLESKLNQLLFVPHQVDTYIF